MSWLSLRSASFLGAWSIRAKALVGLVGLTLLAIAVLANVATAVFQSALIEERLQRGQTILHVVETMFPDATELRGPLAQQRLAAIARGGPDIRRLAIVVPDGQHWRAVASSHEEDLLALVHLGTSPAALTGPIVRPTADRHRENDLLVLLGIGMAQEPDSGGHYFLAPFSRADLAGAAFLLETDAGAMQRTLTEILRRTLEMGLIGVVILVGILFWEVELFFLRPHLDLAAAAFAQYVPPAVAQQIARNPGRIRLSGERRVISVLFTDLKDFTAFSETLEPEVLSQIITEYLDAMTRVVFKHEGTVDKYIGDGVMAFWNAPSCQPDHAQRACLAALEMQRELARLGEQWQQRGLPRQYMRIGINTGPASVGNMGSTLRLAYTAIGDAVNLGARLEPLNDQYATWICLSEYTRAEVGETLRTRYLDLAAVKGKVRPVAVYELVGLEAELSEALRHLLARYEHGIQLYLARRFTEAICQFRAALAVDPRDGPSAIYLQRCLDLAENPPPEAWDGVYAASRE